MDYKEAMLDVLEQLSANGLEGAIPTFVAECVGEMKCATNSRRDMLKWTAFHCERLLNLN
jgi:hypothetical protein